MAELDSRKEERNKKIKIKTSSSSVTSLNRPKKTKPIKINQFFSKIIELLTGKYTRFLIISNLSYFYYACLIKLFGDKDLFEEIISQF